MAHEPPSRDGDRSRLQGDYTSWVATCLMIGEGMSFDSIRSSSNPCLHTTSSILWYFIILFVTMKKYLLLLSIIFILSWCESVRDYEDRVKVECNDMYIEGRCYSSVVAYCTRHSNRSARDGTRNKEERKAYDLCIQVNSWMFSKM